MYVDDQQKKICTLVPEVKEREESRKAFYVFWPAYVKAIY